MTKRFYITTPIYYVNGPPHLGHAYTSIATDVLARFKRLDGFDVFFLTGTDEHGQKVEQAAQAAGMDPQSYVDSISADFRDMSLKMGVSFDDGSAPTEERHKVSCAELWRRIEASGNIYLGHYEGWYAVRDEAFYDEDELTTRPDGSKVAPSGAPVEWVREPSYFFRLSAWQDRLLKLYEEQPDFILATGPAQRGGQLRARRAPGPVDQPDHVPLGHPGAGRAGPRDVCLARCAEQLRHRVRISRRDGSALEVLAGRCAHGRQGHHPFPCRVLAGLPDGGRTALAAAHLLERLVGRRGREDEQVGRQCRRGATARRHVRAGPGALFPVAREAVRRRRQPQPPGDGDADQCRSGE